MGRMKRAPFFQGKMRAQQVAQNVADGAGDADVEHYQTVHQIGEQAGVVAARLSTLPLPLAVRRSKPIRVVKAMMAKVPVPGPIMPSYRPIPRPMASASKIFFQIQRAVVPVLVRQVALPQNDDRCHRQDNEHHGAQHLIAEQQHDVRTQRTARKAADGCKNTHLHVHGTAFEKSLPWQRWCRRQH